MITPSSLIIQRFNDNFKLLYVISISNQQNMFLNWKKYRIFILYLIGNWKICFLIIEFLELSVFTDFSRLRITGTVAVNFNLKNPCSIV